MEEGGQKMNFNSESYDKAQHAIADLKSAVYNFLDGSGISMTNARIGRRLGIYHGHKGHEGHISRTILAMLEADGVIKQDLSTKKWDIR